MKAPQVPAMAGMTPFGIKPKAHPTEVEGVIAQLQQVHDTSSDDFTIDACADAISLIEDLTKEST